MGLLDGLRQQHLLPLHPHPPRHPPQHLLSRHVVKVLRSKLEFERNFSRKHKNKAMKSASAVLILIPIFGLNFLLLPIRPAEGSRLEYTYEVVSCLSTSSQGILVSFLLCF